MYGLHLCWRFSFVFLCADRPIKIDVLVPRRTRIDATLHHTKFYLPNSNIEKLSRQTEKKVERKQQQQQQYQPQWTYGIDSFKKLEWCHLFHFFIAPIFDRQKLLVCRLCQSEHHSNEN